MTAPPGTVFTRDRVVRLVLCAVVAVVAIVGAVWLRGAARSACHITSPLLNGIDLVEYAIVGLIVTAGVFALLEAVGAGWWAVAGTVVISLAAAWLLLVRTEPPASPTLVSSCDQNLPTWWPSALPD
jgi:hypothetical protein